MRRRNGGADAGFDQGAEYFVSPGGSNAAAGSEDAPWATIQHALDTAVAGDVVFIRAGTYRERVSIANSGTAGKPITFIGETDEDGNPLAIIDGSEDAVTWIAAPEVGTGVWKTTEITSEPRCMVIEIDGTTYDIPRLANASGDYAALTVLAWASDYAVETDYLGVTVPWWHGIEAAYYYSSGTTYLRFRDGRDPNSYDVRWCPEDERCITGWGKSYVTFRSLHLRGAYQGIYLSGANNHHLIFERLTITNGTDKIRFYNGPYANIVRDCVLREDNLGALTVIPGAWDDGSRDGSAPVDLARKENLYNAYKYAFSSAQNSDDEGRGINFLTAGTGNMIYNNVIEKTLGGIQHYQTDGTWIFRNTFRNISSFGILETPNSENVRIYGNLFQDVNIPVRFDRLDDDDNARSCYIYNNRFHLPEGVGSHTYWHFEQASSSPAQFPTIKMYHNSFHGGWNCIDISAYAHDNGGLPGTSICNNIINADRWFSGNAGSTFYNDADDIGEFDGNWVGGDDYPYAGAPGWDGDYNFYAEDEYIWPAGDEPDWTLPAGHDTVAGGIDLSATGWPGVSTSATPDIGLMNGGEV